MAETHRLVMIGDTRPSKEALKARGWKWQPGQLCWTMGLVDAHAARLAAGDIEFLKGLNGMRKGCQVTLDGQVIWTSKTYAGPATAAQPAQPVASRVPDQDGIGWSCDQFGNRVAGRAIRGSSPDDME